MENKGARILIIDDEEQMCRLLQIALGAHAYETQIAKSGKEGLSLSTVFQPDLIILDMSLPDIDGLEVVKELREWSKVPVIILSVRESENDKIAALDAGADDYVTKPFNMGELLARIRTAMRHIPAVENEPVLTFDDLTIDLTKRQVTVNNQEVKLTPTEYGVLKALAVYHGRVITHRQLLHMVWGPGYETQTQYLRVYVRQLRHKIEADPTRPRHIITEPAIGFRLL